MLHKKTLEVAKAAIRARVCPQCTIGEPPLAGAAPGDPRPCEPKCQVFINAHKVCKIVSTVHASTMTPYEAVLRELICLNCRESTTAGDYCSERTTMNCPLVRYSNQVVDVVERVLPRRKAKKK